MHIYTFVQNPDQRIGAVSKDLREPVIHRRFVYYCCPAHSIYDYEKNSSSLDWA